MIETTRDNNLIITDEMTVNTVAGLWQSSQDYFKNRTLILKIDLAKVPHSDSAGVALLIAWTRLSHEQNKTLEVINLPEQMQAIIKVSGLENLLPIIK